MITTKDPNGKKREIKQKNSGKPLVSYWVLVLVGFVLSKRINREKNIISQANNQKSYMYCRHASLVLFQISASWCIWCVWCRDLFTTSTWDHICEFGCTIFVRICPIGNIGWMIIKVPYICAHNNSPLSNQKAWAKHRVDMNSLTVSSTVKAKDWFVSYFLLLFVFILRSINRFFPSISPRKTNGITCAPGVIRTIDTPSTLFCCSRRYSCQDD